MNDASPLDLRQLAAQLRHVYNPRTPVISWSAGATWGSARDPWLAVARATAWAATTEDPERLAEHLHAAYVVNIPEQREHGWPPLSDEERDRWLAVADALLKRKAGV
jgi:hypothetical protein